MSGFDSMPIREVTVMSENGWFCISFYDRSLEKELWGLLNVGLACTALYYLN